MKKFGILILIFLLTTGCIASYRFSMLKSTDSSKLNFSDDNIEIYFSFPHDPMWMGVEPVTKGSLQYRQYTGIGFIIKNKTNETITINWDKVSIKDWTGNSGRQVMHTGIKYNECTNLKAVTTIPAKSQNNDIVIPCYALEFKTGSGWVNPRWNISILPSPRQVSKADFGLFMPLQIGNKTIEYNFEFQAIAN